MLTDWLIFAHRLKFAECDAAQPPLYRTRRRAVGARHLAKCSKHTWLWVVFVSSQLAGAAANWRLALRRSDTPSNYPQQNVLYMAIGQAELAGDRTA
jgi:hypothetical protein